MKKISLIILPVLLIFGCSKSVNISNLKTKNGLVYLPHSSDTFSGNFYENDANGNKKIEGIYENGILRNRTEYRKSGYNLFTEFYDNGNKKTEYFIISKELWKLRKYNGPRYDSSFTSWYQNYNMKEKGTYNRGKKDGLWNRWYKDGQKELERTFNNGKGEGLAIIWYENGQKNREWNLKDGLKDGLWTEWYDNGQKMTEGTYKDGELISKKEWNEDGSVKERIIKL